MRWIITASDWRKITRKRRSSQGNSRSIQVWSFGDGNVTNGSYPSGTHVYTDVGTYTVRLDAYTAGLGWRTITKTNYITVPNPTGIQMHFIALDQKNGMQVATVNTGIKNISSGVWRNVTGSSGRFWIQDTGSNHEYQLTAGEGIGVDLTAIGYDESYNSVTVQNGTSATNPMPLYMSKTSDAIYNGTWNLVVNLNDCDTGKPLPAATLTVTTGMNGWCTAGCLPTYTSGGMYSWYNVTASLIAYVDMKKSYYQAKTDTIQLQYPTNYTTTKTYCLSPIGSTITPTATPTINGSVIVTTVPTTGAYPVPTDTYGNPITDNEEKGLAAFGLLVDAAYAIMGIVVGCIFIWLLWMVVYLISGGKIIDKIMRRGRR